MIKKDIVFHDCFKLSNFLHSGNPDTNKMYCMIPLKRRLDVIPLHKLKDHLSFMSIPPYFCYNVQDIPKRSDNYGKSTCI